MYLVTLRSLKLHPLPGTGIFPFERVDAQVLMRELVLALRSSGAFEHRKLGDSVSPETSMSKVSVRIFAELHVVVSGKMETTGQ